MFDPELAIERAIEYYRRKGYTEDWISQPLFSIRARKNLTFEWRERGVKTNSEYAILTNDIYHAWSDLTARECEPLLAEERTRCRIERLACAPFGRPVITSATAPDFGRLIMEVIEVQAIEEEGDALNADAAE